MLLMLLFVDIVVGVVVEYGIVVYVADVVAVNMVDVLLIMLLMLLLMLMMLMSMLMLLWMLLWMLMLFVVDIVVYVVGVVHVVGDVAIDDVVFHDVVEVDGDVVVTFIFTYDHTYTLCLTKQKSISSVTITKRW